MSAKFLIVFIGAFLLIYIVSPLAATNDINTTVVASTANASIITQANDTVNILFSIIIGTLGVLSYLQARKTIFMPIKTETFKLQLKIFEQIFSYFDHHKKQYFIDSFDYRKIFDSNTFFLFHSYAGTFFKDEIQFDEERIRQMLSEVPLKNMAFKHVDKIQSTNDDIILDLRHVTTDVHSPTDRLTEWLKYECIMIHITNNFQNQMDQLDSFISSPLVPSNIKNLIREFQVAAYHNIHAMAEVLTEAAKELPGKYQSADAFKKAKKSWIWNMYIHKQTRLEDISDKIYQNINKYLNTDKLLQ